MAFCSWQYTFTTFCPETISSMKPFTRPRFRWRSTKYFRDSFPRPVVTLYIRKAITTDTSVSGRLRTSMLINVAMMVTSDLNKFGTLLPTTCRSVSTSLVYTDMTSPWEWLSKYWSGSVSIWENKSFRICSMVPCPTLIMMRFWE